MTATCALASNPHSMPKAPAEDAVGLAAERAKRASKTPLHVWIGELIRAREVLVRHFAERAAKTLL